jgi:Na+:H+ antiporter, NhaA family
MERIHQLRLFIYHLFSRQVVKPTQNFFRKEAGSSILLLGATLLALIWANSKGHAAYDRFWHTLLTLRFGNLEISHILIHWVDDGLMALFFFIVGLEIKREFLVGELSSPKKALFPVVAAIGGMLVPGLIYAFFNHGAPSSKGWGIPMATDIAFALGAIAIFGKKLPPGLRVFLAAFAIADDLGAVLVIALFYTGNIMVSNLVVCGILLVFLGIANFFWVRSTLIYAVLGISIWFSIMESGIHPTVAGILVSMFIPAQGKYETDKFIQNVKNRLEQFQCGEQSCGFSILLNKDHLDAVQGIEIDCHNVETPLQRMEHALHPWVAFIILPLFALGNAGLTFNEIDFSAALSHPVSLGIILGLFAGKPIGIMLFSYMAVKAKIASLPDGLQWPHIAGASLFGGIGFTMSLFISKLSFVDPNLMNYAKFSILFASVLSGVAGIIYLTLYLKKPKSANNTNK